MGTETIYDEYAVLTAQIKELEEKKDKIKVDILKDMEESGAERAECPMGKFTITRLKTWTYTPVVTKMIEDIKELKAIEESTGEATFEEKPSLRFIPLKL